MTMNKYVPTFGDAKRFAKHPVHALKGERKVPAAMILFTALVAIAFMRRHALPDQRGLIAIAGSAFVLVAVASFAPDLVTWVLLVAVIVSAIQNRDVIGELVTLGQNRFAAAVNR